MRITGRTEALGNSESFHPLGGVTETLKVHGLDALNRQITVGRGSPAVHLLEQCVCERVGGSIPSDLGRRRDERLTENADLDEVEGLEDGSDEGSGELQEVRDLGLQDTANGGQLVRSGCRSTKSRTHEL